MSGPKDKYDDIEREYEELHCCEFDADISDRFDDERQSAKAEARNEDRGISSADVDEWGQR